MINTQEPCNKFTRQKTVAENFCTSLQKLHLEFVRLGGMRHKLKNRMLSILPEIYESGIYKKYAVSIVEYAGKYGDIAKTTVIKRLRLEENLQDKPCLKAAIEKVGVHKVAMVAKIATPETDQIFAENLLNMSKAAVQSLSKELRTREDEDRIQNQLFASGYQSGRVFAPLCKAVPRTTKIELDEESTFLLMKLKAKLGKDLSDKDLLKLILKEREKEEFQEVKSRAKNKFPKVSGASKASDEKSVTGDTFTETRYIHADKKRRIIAQTNGKCSYPNCNSPFQILHHADRYSQSKNHDSITPLCKIHHEFAHNNLIQNETQTPDKWQISIIKPSDFKILPADVLYKKYRREAFG